jgi:hypothetical protein
MEICFLEKDHGICMCSKAQGSEQQIADLSLLFFQISRLPKHLPPQLEQDAGGCQRQGVLEIVLEVLNKMAKLHKT